MNVPALPSVDEAVLERHRDEHLALAASLNAAAPEARAVFTFLQRRLLLESLAYLQPVLAGPPDQLLLPPPRAFLDERQVLRLAGAAAAFRHLDSRVVMQRAGWISAVVDPTTPLAVHALLEGGLPSGRETNAGMWRVTPTSWRPEANAFEHPDARLVPELVAEAIDVATTSSAPACVRAAWLTFTVLSIHPFVDGNGRTARALFLGVAAEDLELGVDWGILEQWSLARYGYVEALQAGQQLPGYDGAQLDATAFVNFSTVRSAEGAATCRRRLEQLEGELVGWQSSGLSADAATIAAVVRHSVFTGPEELAPLGVDGIRFDIALNELMDAGVVGWLARPASRRTSVSTSSHGLVVTARRSHHDRAQ